MHRQWARGLIGRQAPLVFWTKRDNRGARPWSEASLLYSVNSARTANTNCFTAIAMKMLSELGANGGVQTEFAACVLLRTFVGGLALLDFDMYQVSADNANRRSNSKHFLSTL